jgi:hypothetical protein
MKLILNVIRELAIFIETLLICIGAATILFLVASYAEAGDFKIVEVQEVTIQYRHYFPGGYNYMINANGLEGKSLGQGVNLIINTDFLKYLYWNNLVHSTTDRNVNSLGQFRHLGWQFAIGTRIASMLSVEYYHHSQHLLDHKHILGRFPVEDAININLQLLNTTPKPGLLGF